MASSMTLISLRLDQSLQLTSLLLIIVETSGLKIYQELVQDLI
jgi:hypothetical protein